MSTSHPLFTSSKERRLWLWTAATLVAIYSTLGPASALAEFLREHNLLKASVAIVLVALLATAVVRFFRRRPSWQDVGVALGVALAYSLVWVRMGSVEERTHLIEYGVVAALIHLALLERKSNGASVANPALVAIIATATFGLIDESIQAFLPSRVFDFRDIFFNALAGFMIVAARLAIAPQTGPGWRAWFLWLMAAAIGWGNGVYWGWFVAEDPKLLQSIPSNIVAGYTGIVVGALAVGILQWLVLRKFIKQPIRWIASSLAALAVLGAIIFGGGGLFTPESAWIVGVSVFGTVVGVFQWLVVRDQVPFSIVWILASTIGWAVGMPVGDAVGPPGLGAVYGAITGCAMVWLLRQVPAAAGTADPQ